MPASLEKLTALEEVKTTIGTLFNELQTAQEAQDNEKLLSERDKLKTALQTLIDAREALWIDEQAEESQAWDDALKIGVTAAMQGSFLQIQCIEGFVMTLNDDENSNQDVLSAYAEISQTAKDYIDLRKPAVEAASLANLLSGGMSVDDDTLFSSLFAAMHSANASPFAQPAPFSNEGAALSLQHALLSSMLQTMMLREEDMLSQQEIAQMSQMRQTGSSVSVLVISVPRSGTMFRPVAQTPIQFPTTSGSTVTPAVASSSAANDAEGDDYEMDMDGEEEQKQSQAQPQAKDKDKKKSRCRLM